MSRDRHPGRAAGIARRTLLLAAGATGLTGVAPAARSLRPEDFGAAGDGITDDSAALARLAAAVTRAGGGVVELRRTTYLVGRQDPAPTGGYAYRPAPLLAISGCRAPLVILGHGARLLAAPDLRYGVFDRRGAPRRTAMPYFGDGLATPYVAMIEITGCRSSVTIRDIELAGPGDRLRIGGGYGDTGRQIAGSGLVLRDNLGAEEVSAVHSHGHPLDGMIIDGDDRGASAPRLITGLRCDRNGRQGLSIVGGRGYVFHDCAFTRTGRGAIASAPGAGVDIEAEGSKRVRDLRFERCAFVDNMGVGMVADSGDSADVRFDRCHFVGTTAWSAWPRKPGFRFTDCRFTGALCNAYGSDDPARAAQFLRCAFDDDPAAVPGRPIYRGAGARTLADLSSERNMLFDRCRFTARHGAALPWSTAAIYRECVMVQGQMPQGYPRGTFVGTNRISGNVALDGSRFLGPVFVNGARIGG